MSNKSPDNDKSNVMTSRDTLHRIATGFILSRALMTAAELKIADTLKDKKKTALEIAKELDLHPESVKRLLRYLASHNIFNENSENQFSLTALSEIMVTDHQNSFHAFLEMIADTPPWDSFKHMMHTLKTGEPAFDYLHNQSFFNYMAEHPESNAKFNAGMSCFSSPDNSNIVNAYDFGNDLTVVDIGGGKGSFLAMILSMHTNTHGILYDQSDIVNEPNEEINNLAGDRCQIISGDFFQSVPTGGDIYTLKLILHDWDDQQAVKILTNIHEVLPDNGKVLVIEGIMLDGNEPDPHKQLDISMMTIFGGRERTIKEFETLFKSAGLQINKVIDTPSRLSIIEAVKH